MTFVTIESSKRERKLGNVSENTLSPPYLYIHHINRCFIRYFVESLKSGNCHFLRTTDVDALRIKSHSTMNWQFLYGINKSVSRIKCVGPLSLFLSPLEIGSSLTKASFGNVRLKWVISNHGSDTNKSYNYLLREFSETPARKGTTLPSIPTISLCPFSTQCREEKVWPFPPTVCFIPINALWIRTAVPGENHS